MLKLHLMVLCVAWRREASVKVAVFMIKGRKASFIDIRSSEVGVCDVSIFERRAKSTLAHSPAGDALHAIFVALTGNILR